MDVLCKASFKLKLLETPVEKRWKDGIVPCPVLYITKRGYQREEVIRPPQLFTQCNGGSRGGKEGRICIPSIKQASMWIVCIGELGIEEVYRKRISFFTP